MEIIQVNDVWKKYRLYHDKGSTLKEKLLFRKRNYYEETWVLKAINLTVRQGEAVGLIGENGSGKSTLLKLLTKIIYPNRGELSVKGKVSSLLELGAGFHPDMTGKDNIYINASIFGLTRQEIDSKLNDIISFSGLGDYIDSAIRTYSSGMYMRLAFAVAINVDADILLIDEILAVGDANFQAKCFDKLQELKNKGVTVIIVSHDLTSIERLCNRALWLDDGQVQSSGNPHYITREYLEAMANKRQDNLLYINKSSDMISDQCQTEANSNRYGNKYYELKNLKMLDRAGKDMRVFKTSEKVVIVFDYIKNNKDETNNPVIGIGIFRNDGIECYGTNTQIDRLPFLNTKDKGNVRLEIENLFLIEGEYILDIAIVSQDGFPYDFIKNVTRFSVYSNIKDVGIVRLKHKWIIDY